MAGSVTSAVARKVATVTAILPSNTVTSVVPTQTHEATEEDNGLWGDQPGGSNEYSRPTNPEHIEIPSWLENAVKDELKSNPELFQNGRAVEHLVVGADNIHVAVKQFNEVGEFDSELRIQKKFRSLAISEALGSFTTDNRHYIVFPWAEHGSLRDFWYKNPDPTRVPGQVELWMIQQCFRVSDALQQLHGHKSATLTQSDSYARHGDIKPKTFSFSAVTRWLRSRARPVKITDFGLASFHSLKAEKVIGKFTKFTPAYRPPEMDITNASIGRAADVWSLGCLFLEFITWYVQGAAALDAFSRARSAAKEDTFFSIEGRENERPQVIQNPAITELIENLRRHPRSTKTVRSFLGLIEFGMLQVSKDKRPTAAVVAETLRCLSIESSESLISPPGPINGEICVSPNDEQLLLTLYDARKPPSIFDRWRIWLEDYIGLGPIDWYPLSPVNRLQNETQSKLTWHYNDQELAIILNEDETKRCRDIVPLAVNQKTSLATTDSSGSSSRSQSRAANSNNQSHSGTQKTKNIEPRGLRSRKRGRGLRRGRSPSIANSNYQEVDQKHQECYFCIDKARLTNPETHFSDPVTTNNLRDDTALFELLKKRLMFNFTPWMTYNAVNLCQFPRKESEICDGYSRPRSTPKSLPLDIYMRVIGITILAGLKHPDSGWNTSNVLDALPKRWAPPSLLRSHRTIGWAFHIRFGVSFLSVALWILGLMLLGLAFVPIWLALVDKKDLQNAFTPASTLFSIAAMLLAWAALIQNRW
ncbi:hypothetical protein RRF57_012213 [Xylaria bambusicola]|uniref:Protein kinase domain-containing protein n=1 Tax=Xylaria bambusicola TaxID=326684 RepID=A0AAN7ZDI1_9PEZI